MDIPSEEIVDAETTGDPYQYDFQRVSTYDPNMCSTAARLSPLYNGQSIGPTDLDAAAPPDISNPAYGEIILVQCDEQQVDAAELHVESHRVERKIDLGRSYYQHIPPSFIKYSSETVEGDAVQVDHQLYCHESAPASDGEGISYIQQIQEGINEVTGEPITTQILLHRSPNGHIYQNYYVANEDGVDGEIVEMVQIATDVGGTPENSSTPFVDATNDPNLPTSADYEFRHEIEHRNEFIEDDNDGEMIDHLGVHSVAVHVGEEFLDSYEDQQHVLAATKEDRRMLLESTMLPLLAAVNDITQRDAELQSYLNQSVDRDNNSIFSIPLGSRRNDDKHLKRKTEFDEISDEDDDYLLVSDKPVESRARASLPTNYLVFGKIEDDTGAPSVYSKKDILPRTKFGPLEGEIRFTSDIMMDVFRTQTQRYYPLLLLGESRILVVRNEECSNWMGFVRMAQTFGEQNLHLIQEDDGKLYFKCCRHIRSNEELKVGYSSSYALLHGLHALLPTEEESRQINEKLNPWSCFECDARFSTSKAFQEHLNEHDSNDSKAKPKSKRRLRKTKSQQQRILDISKNSIRCFYCLKVFMTHASLKKHLAMHLVKNPVRFESPPKTQEIRILKCEICNRRFNSQNNLKKHQLIHSKNEQKPYKCSECDQHCATPAALAAHIRSHANRPYTCVYCQQSFKHVISFKNHVSTHAVDGMYYCNHCKRKYQEYHLVRKHIRIFHPENKHPCNECGRQFLHISFLRRHKAIHSEKKQFLCSECGYQFRRKDKLKEHIKRVHSDEAKNKKKKLKDNPKKLKKESPIPTSSEPMVNDDDSQYLKISPKKPAGKESAQTLDISESYQNCMYKCDDCMLGFKRRGMLVNHITKRHPEISIDTIAELNMPIVKAQTLFYCEYCSKVYKSNAKRKAHILKNHPGQQVPPPVRSKSTAEELNIKTVGSVRAEIQKCQWCYKQYSSRNRLLAHYRKSHVNMENVEEVYQPHPQQLLDEVFHERMEVVPIPSLDTSRSPSPENKLLKLSSAAMKLSKIDEDNKLFSFLSEKKDPVQNINCNYKIVDNEFSENSSTSSTELNRFPQLFEEPISDI